MPALSVRRMAGRAGAEISGVDLGQELDEETIDGIWEAVLRHRVVFFRGADIGHARHVAFGRRFGALTRRPGARPGAHPDGFPEILTGDPLAGWHSDLTQMVNPPTASILRAETCPGFGGDTQWANMADAYAGLAGPLRELVDGLRAEHAFFAGVPLPRSGDRDRDVFRSYRDAPEVTIHPVVRVHPETEEKALFVSPGTTTRIMGFSRCESDQILSLLYQHMTSAEYTVRFRWEPGSIAMWDNRSTCHFASADFAHLGYAARRMHCVTLLGESAVGPDGFVSQPVAGEPMSAC